jgi:type IV secretion system protein VirB8
MLRNKAVTPNVENSISQAVNYEVTVADMAKRSEKRAWFVAFTAIVMSLILAAGYFYMLPLKREVPYLVMADAFTGTSTVARLTTDTNYQAVTANEAINKSNVAHFVLARESYDRSLIGTGSWTTVHVMATNNVSAEYREVHSSKNPYSPAKLYENNKAIRVKILSITLNRDSSKAVVVDEKGVAVKGPPTSALVRIQRNLFVKSTGQLELLDNKIIAMEFNYNPNLKMTDDGRVLNPLGFQVTSYRADNDFSEAPRAEYRAQAQAPVAQPAEALPGEVPPIPGYPDADAPAQDAAPATPPNSQPPASNPSNNVNGASTR